MIAPASAALTDDQAIALFRIARQIVTSRNLLGALEVAANAPDALGEDESRVIEELATQAAVAIAHSQQAELLEHLQCELLENQKLATLAEVAHGLTHELNTPLGIIVSNLSVLQEYGVAVAEFSRVGQQAVAQLQNNEAPDAVAQALDAAARSTDLPYILNDLPLLTAESAASADRIAGIVRTFAIFARQVPNRLSAVQVEDELEAAVLLVWSTLKHRAPLVRHYGGVPTVAGQLSELAQVFARLLLYAAEWLPSTDASITLTTASADSHVSVVVDASDNGSGLPHLRGPFDSPVSARQPGEHSNLGLDVCRGILANFGGSMVLETSPGRPGQSMRVTVRLPIAQPVSRTSAGVRG